MKDSTHVECTYNSLSSQKYVTWKGLLYTCNSLKTGTIVEQMVDIIDHTNRNQARNTGQNE